MLEIIEQIQNEAIVTLTLAIVALIKDKGVLAKVNTRLISLVVSVVLVVAIKYIAIGDTALLVIENVALIVLPSFGYDYLIDPIIKPLIEKFKK